MTILASLHSPLTAWVSGCVHGGCHRRHRPSPVRLTLAAWAFLTVVAWHPVDAQTPSGPTSVGSTATAVTLDATREELYEELAAEFSAFDRLGNLVRRVSQLAKPSVIHIEAHKVEGSGAAAEAYDEAGSGVLLNLEGSTWLLTNRHVIAGASAAEITLRSADGRRWFPARILTDASTDVALMQLSSSKPRSPSTGRRSPSTPAVDRQVLPPVARIGDSQGVEIGDFTIAIGSPFGLSHSVTFGIISAKGRRDLSLGEQRIDLQDFFQTDAAINPGNSGGPLLNLRGEVIGLNTAIASSSGGSEGIGFAIPINMAIRVAEQLIRHGKLQRGYLGVTLDPNFSAADLSASDKLYASMRVPTSGTALPTESVSNPLGGARVKEVRRGSPAESARLQRGDIVLRFGQTDIEDDDHLVACVGLAPLDEPIDMVILRQGQRYRTTVTLTRMP